MSEIVRRVAQAIADNLVLPEGTAVDFEYCARAAIDGMREPTKAMLQAAHQQAYEIVAEEVGDADPALVFVDEEENARTVGRYHCSMIDAALAE